MESGHTLSYRKLIALIFVSSVFSSQVFCQSVSALPEKPTLFLNEHKGFLRFSYDNVSMPHKIADMGLLGLAYYGDITPQFYGGIGGYGSVTGTQGGLFVLGFGGGFHTQFANNWWADIGAFVGGGGGRSSLVGGGLMLKPYAGIAYDFKWAKLGLHYSYIDFPSGLIHSQQVGLDLDVPLDFYYVNYTDAVYHTLDCARVNLTNGKFLTFQRNDFAIILQAYRQKPGTKSVNGIIQDGTVGLVGAELDHYMTEKLFWWLQAGGAYTGVPNGYMDVLGGLGYHQVLDHYGIAIVPQLGIGAGGGGEVDTGGGILMTPQIGLEIPLNSAFAARLTGGYLWAPKGQLKAVTATAAIIYHLNLASGDCTPFVSPFSYHTQGWRVNLFNQTYIRPQRTFTLGRPTINLVAVQLDQLLSPFFFFSYQGAFAYAGDHAGGYATGMIGPGIQSPLFLNESLQLFAEVLVGAGGGGSLSLGGGSIIEPVVGLHYALSETWGLTTSLGQLKALRHDLNTTVFNLGLTIRFGTLNRV